MFKKALQIAMTFGMLLAGYAGYVRVFALVARGFNTTGPTAPLKLVAVPSKTHVKAVELAKAAFGPDHWTTTEDLPIKLYNHDRGFWMYARDYDRNKDGKHVTFSPFAIIMTAADGRVVKTATSDVARIELDKAFNLAPTPGASNSLRVVHARIEGNVHLRDDKGTPKNTADDLRIGPLDWIEYDEPKLQINSESAVVIEDDVYRITGTGLMIKLRPKDNGLPRVPGVPNGFEEAQTAYLFKNVHILINDVGAGGILPGTSQGQARTKPAARVPTPLDLRCDGLMQIDFPKRRVEALVGPPSPSEPTIAQFSRNVEVVRGTTLPNRDQLNSDHLRLTLVPPVRPRGGTPPAPAPQPDALSAENDASASNIPDPTAPSPAAKGPMNDLTLREAVASGHNVRLVSAAQDIKVRCNELIYKKQDPGKSGRPAADPDTTYFRGDRTTGLIIEKIERAGDGPKKGQVSTFTTLRAIDATIFDDHRGNDYAVIVASGPGEMEARPGPGLNGAIERTAHWNDRLTIRPITPAASARPEPQPQGPVRKRITLTGKPGFRDIPAKATLDGRDKLSTIDIWLKPKAPAVVAKAPSAPQPGGGSYEIEHLVATKDVLLVTPSRTLTARNDLQAMFIPVDDPSPAAPSPASTSVAKPAATASATSASAPAPAPAATPATTPAPTKPAEPEAKASADRVWARILLRPAPAGPLVKQTAASTPATPGLFGGGPTGARKSEVDEVRLRGNVAIHQAPAPGKARGTAIAGDAVDLFNQGGKGSKFIVYSAEPKTKSGMGDADLFSPLAMVDSDQMVIRGRRIGLDQATDYAWVDGNGSVTQLTSRGLLSDKAPAADPKSKSADPRTKAKVAARPATPDPASAPMTIFFSGLPDYGKGMRFYGKSTDPTGRRVAKAEFFKDVHAETDDATLDCEDVLTTYFDRTVKLARGAEPKTDPDAPPEPKAEIALIECVKNVDVVNSKRDPESKAIVQRQRISGDRLLYERSTGKFRVPGQGMVYLYELESQNGPLGRPGPAPAPAGRGVVRPIAGPAADRPVPVRRGGAVVGRTDPRNPASPNAAAPKAARPKTPPPLVLTQVRFTTEMHGRFGTGKETDKADDRWADFFGDVETFRARVAGPDVVIDPENPPRDVMSLTAETMRVVSEPPKAAAVERDPTAPPRYLLRAWENAFAATVERTIQADTITYDSASNLLYAYGEDGRDVIIAQQNQPGQAASVVPGRTLRYNLKTGESQLADPKAIQFFDSKTGSRPDLAPAPSDKVKPRLPPRKPFINRSNNLERKGYTGT